MTKEITKVRIIQEIQDRFKLRELEPEVFGFSERVVPIYDVVSHLKRWLTTTVTLSITSLGGKLIAVVPNDERWTLNGYSVIFMAAGAYKVSGVYLGRKNNLAIFVYLDLTKEQTQSYTVNLPKPATLDSGDKLSVNIDHYTSTADLMVNLDIVKEEIR